MEIQHHLKRYLDRKLAHPYEMSLKGTALIVLADTNDATRFESICAALKKYFFIETLILTHASIYERYAKLSVWQCQALQYKSTEE
jgi:hypothetical protein